MGNAASTAYEHIFPLLEKLPDSLKYENITRKDVSIAVAALLGIYYGGSFIAKCYQAHRVRKALQDVPNKPSIFTGNLSDVRFCHSNNYADGRNNYCSQPN